MQEVKGHPAGGASYGALITSGRRVKGREHRVPRPSRLLALSKRSFMGGGGLCDCALSVTLNSVPPAVLTQLLRRLPRLTTLLTDSGALSQPHLSGKASMYLLLQDHCLCSQVGGPLCWLRAVRWTAAYFKACRNAAKQQGKIAGVQSCQRCHYGP
jgi:hypothetical protein